MDTDPTRTIKPVYSVTRFLDSAGLPFSLNHTGNGLSVSSVPFLYDIAMGNVPGHSAILISGRNPDVDNILEDTWEPGGLYVPPPITGIQLSLQSTSVADASLGTGAHTVDLDVLLTDYTEITIQMVLNGITSVLTTQTNIIRINRFHVMIAGTGKVAAGNLTITNVAKTIIYSQITAGLNTQRQAIYTVPAGKTLFIANWKYFVGSSSLGKYAEFLLRATTSDTHELLDIFHVKDETNYVDGGDTIGLPVPIKVVATADVKVSVAGDAANSNAICIAGFSGWIQEN